MSYSFRSPHTTSESARLLLSMLWMLKVRKIEKPCRFLLWARPEISAAGRVVDRVGHVN